MDWFYVESLELYAIRAVGVAMEPMRSGGRAGSDLAIAAEKVTANSIESMATHGWPVC